MKRTLLIIAAAAALVSCEKEKKQDPIIHEQTPEKPEQPAAVTSFTAIVTDYDYGDTKATVTEDDTRGKATVSWESGDRISINGQVFTSGTSGYAVTFTNPSADVISPYKAIYPASLDTGTDEYTFHAVQTHTEGKAADLPMYACSDNTILTFRNICAVLAITIPEGPVATKVEVSSGKAMNGRFTVEGYAAVMTKTDGLTDDEKKVTVHGCFASGAVVYVAVPPADYTDLTVRLITESETITYTKALNAAANHIYHITVPPAGTLNGLFTVRDPDGKPGSGDEVKVRFSKGNLYYDGRFWKFEDHQYDYRTYTGKNSCIGGNITANGTPYDNWGLFGWSTASTAYGMSTSTNSNSYSGSFVDWGHNAIANGGNTADLWRTMSTAEWTYLLNVANATSGARTDAKRYVKAVVHSVKGLIIFPDSYAGITAGIHAANINNAGTSTFSTIADADWISMESSGCVFLPAAGARQGTNIVNVSSEGRFWSSTIYDMHFYNDAIHPQCNNNLSYGKSVRLVSATR